MNIKKLYINKLFGYLQKLFKPAKQGVLLRINQAAYTATQNALKNTIAQATNDDFSSSYTFDFGTTTNRQVPDGQSPKIRAEAEGQSPDGFASSLFLTNFAPSSRSLRVGSEVASTGLRRTCRESRSPLEGDSGEGRTRLEQRSKKSRRNAVKHQTCLILK